MPRLLLAVILGVLCHAPVWAQVLASGSITTAGADCATETNCLHIGMVGAPGTTVYIDVGTSGTFVYEATTDATSVSTGTWFSVTDRAGAASATVDGAYSFVNLGWVRMRVRASAISGTATLSAALGHSAIGQIIVNGIAVTSTDGVTIANDTASTAGVPAQQSPRLRFHSNVWNTTTPANNTNDFWIESVPASGATPSGMLKFGKSLNGGATTYPLTLTSAGVLVATQIYATQTGWLGIQNVMTITGVASGQIVMTTANQGSGVGFDVATPSILKLRTAAHTGNASLALNSALTFSSTIPSVASGFCTTPVVLAGTTATAFQVTVGTSCAGSVGALTLPTATNGWTCDVKNLTTPASNNVEQTASTTTSASFTNYARTTGVAANFADSNVLVGSCTAF